VQQFQLGSETSQSTLSLFARSSFVPHSLQRSAETSSRLQQLFVENYEMHRPAWEVEEAVSFFINLSQYSLKHPRGLVLLGVLTTIVALAVDLGSGIEVSWRT
jgi:hypothetical protein